MLSRREAGKILIGVGVIMGIPYQAFVYACPPPKYKPKQLVELTTGARLFVVKSRVDKDMNLYSLSYVEGGEIVVEIYEKELKNVSK